MFYHKGCIQAGPPFRSRHRDPTQGLVYNPHLLAFPFICELCTVRINVQRELRPLVGDMQLLQLERMRMIDQSNSWSQDTGRGVAGSMKYMSSFLRVHEITTTLREGTPELSHPPVGGAILMLWAMERFTLQPSTSKNHEFITYNSARALRSALSQLHTWSGSLLPAGTGYRDKDRTFLSPLVSQSGSLICQLTTSGMERRLGTENTPSLALQAHHVRYHLGARDRIMGALSPHLPIFYQYALAQLAELLAWTGWLRANEIFSLRWQDIEVIRPSARPTHGLPPGSGALLLRLLESTKSDQSRTADHIIAFTTASGLSPGDAFLRVQSLRGSNQGTDEYIFVTQTGARWNSTFFRENYVYPFLYDQLAQGDPLLRTYAKTDRTLLRRRLYSMHSWRRGGRTHVSRKRPGCVRPASDQEIRDHGRWRSRGSVGPDMATHYREPSYEDRLYITLLCM